MTREELLAKIDKWYDYARGSIAQVHSEFCIGSDRCQCDKYDLVTDEVYKAFRAVVELHKPRKTGMAFTYCVGCKSTLVGQDYCGTIQVIMKELQ